SPLRLNYVENKLNIEIEFERDNRNNLLKGRKIKKVFSKIFYDDLIVVKQNNISFSLNPLINVNKSVVKDDENKYWQNTRGFEIHGTLGEKLSFYTEFFENQAYFLPYINENINQRFVVPGQGAWKDFGDDRIGKDYNYASGFISFTPIQSLNFQFGSAKHFIGSGYRSLLLSDNSFSYPFLKASFTKNKFQYTVMFTEFQTFKTRYYYYRYKKHATFLFLNYSPVPNVEIGLFEGIIWHTSDNKTYVNHFPALFFVPLPGIREIVYGFNHENNALVGLNFRAKTYKYGDIYAQFVLDDFSQTDFNKRYAFQIGAKTYDFFADKIKFNNLFLQLEYNYAKPYTFTHENEYSAYTNTNESLTSTLGSGYKELLGILSWDFYGFNLSAKLNKIISSTDTLDTNFGSNLLQSNTNATFENEKNIVGQGLKADIFIKKLHFSYIVNSKTNLQIYIELEIRKYKTDITKDDLFFVSFGIKNKIRNFYTDY
ncbi:MAG: hypothetical protein U9Q83_04425, partial [Bacteroidota bacterium]|nr:hypothetical protein [Bacteroidota bacterium]